MPLTLEPRMANLDRSPDACPLLSLHPAWNWMHRDECTVAEFPEFAMHQSALRNRYIPTVAPLIAVRWTACCRGYSLR